MADRYEHLEKAMCKELEKLDKKYTADVEMTEQDAERADKLYHALKSAATYHAMKDAEEMEKEEMGEYSAAARPVRRNYSYHPMSYAPWRSPMATRPIRREVIDDGYSGRYPMESIDPYWDRRFI